MMKYWIIRHPFKALFSLLGIAAAAFFAVVLWAGYALLRSPCDDWHRGMTREEKILMALEFANDSNSLVFESLREDGTLRRSLERQIPYEDAETILHEQPDCCHLYEQTSALTDHPSEEVHGGDEGVVVLRYMGQYGYDNDKKYPGHVFWYADFNACKNR